MLLILLALISNSAFAEPCWEKKVPLSFTGVNVFQDCADDSLLYFLPQELNITERSFDGTKSFAWKEQSGQARVAMEVQLFHSENLIVQAIRNLKQRVPKRYSILPIEVKDLTLEGFGNLEDGVLESKMTTSSGLSNAFFRISIRLNEQGIKLWKDSTQFGDFIVQAATLKYKMKFSKGGQEQWIENTNVLNIASIPSCILQGSPECEKRDSKDILLTEGKDLGSRYFYMQFSQCTDFTTGFIFNTPSRSESTHPHFSNAEGEIFYNAVLDGYHSSKEAQRKDCSPVIEDWNGYSWLKLFAASQRITCNNRGDWPWDRLNAMIPAHEGKEYRGGAHRAYEEICPNLPELKKWVCDERQGDQECHPKQLTKSKVCFSSSKIKEKLQFQTGFCRFNTFDSTGGFALINSPVVTVSVQEATSIDTCFEMTTRITRGEFLKGQVICDS